MKGEFYKVDFPISVNDFVYLSRPIEPAELQLGDKDIIIDLCCQLKRMELKYYCLYHDLMNEKELIEIEKQL